MKFAKLLVGLGFIISLGSLGGNWYLYERFQAGKANSQRLESNVVQLGEQNSTLKQEVTKAEETKQENERLQAQIKDYVGQRDSLKKELDTTSLKTTELQKQIRKLESEKEDLVKQLDTAKATETAVAEEAEKLPVVPAPSVSALPTAAPSQAAVVPSLAPKPQPAAGETKSLAKTAPAAPQKKETVTAAKKEEKKAPAVQKKEEKKQEKSKAVPATASKPAEDTRPQQVLSVNRQFNFVVVNVGLRDRVKIGDVLRVEESGKQVGRVQVEKLYENFSACAIVEEMKPAQIREGDLVRVA